MPLLANTLDRRRIRHPLPDMPHGSAHDRVGNRPVPLGILPVEENGRLSMGRRR